MPIGCALVLGQFILSTLRFALADLPELLALGMVKWPQALAKKFVRGQPAAPLVVGLHSSQYLVLTAVTVAALLTKRGSWTWGLPVCGGLLLFWRGLMSLSSQSEAHSKFAASLLPGLVQSGRRRVAAFLSFVIPWCIGVSVYSAILGALALGGVFDGKPESGQVAVSTTDSLSAPVDSIQSDTSLSLGGGRPRPRATKERQLTFGSSPDQMPKWSPDGTKIAFHSDRSGNVDIWLIADSGGNPVRLTKATADEGMPEWSPDGTRIAFTKYAVSARDGRGDLYVMSADGSGEADRLTSNGKTWIFGCSWDSSNNSLVYGEMRGSPSSPVLAIWRIDVSTKARTMIITDYAGGVAVSPNGRMVAFDAMDLSIMQRRLYVLDVDCGRVRTLVDDLDRPWFPSWSPDGKWIFFHAGKGGAGGVWAVAVDGSVKVKLLASGRYPDVSPDGRRLVYTKGQYDAAHIWVAEITYE